MLLLQTSKMYCTESRCTLKEQDLSKCIFTDICAFSVILLMSFLDIFCFLLSCFFILFAFLHFRQNISLPVLLIFNVFWCTVVYNFECLGFFFSTVCCWVGRKAQIFPWRATFSVQFRGSASTLCCWRYCSTVALMSWCTIRNLFTQILCRP